MLENALKVIEKIVNSGYEAYIVGGFVRDYLLGIESNDIDINTNATPRELVGIFKDAVSPSEDYGSVSMFFAGIRFDITTFRKEIGYVNNRKPLEIEYISSLREDLLRRDFTVNSLCINKDGEVIDLLNVKTDVYDKVIKCIGNPDLRFKEDSLRILRAIRFATVLDFKIDEETKKAIIKNKELLKNLSYYRKKEELNKIFSSINVLYGIKLLISLDLVDVLEIPNLKDVAYTSSLIGIWSFLDVVDKYPFTSSEKHLIKEINKVKEHNNLDAYILYKYGLYVNSVVGEMKGIDIKDITYKYDSLTIKNRKDININSDDIVRIVNKKPGSYINDIYKNIEKEIIYKRLVNEKEKIEDYIKSHWG